MKTADEIWKTCCALHNWLLEVDGLDARWEQGIPTSVWEGAEGDHDVQDIEMMGGALCGVDMQTFNMQRFDCSGMGPANDHEENDSGGEEDEDLDQDSGRGGTVDDEEQEDELEHEQASNPRGIRVVREMTSLAFRSKLVTHFDIASQKSEVQWPTRKDVEQEPNIN